MKCNNCKYMYCFTNPFSRGCHCRKYNTNVTVGVFSNSKPNYCISFWGKLWARIKGVVK